VDKLKTTTKSNTSTLESHGHVSQELEMKLVDIVDRKRQCNIRIIGLKEILEGANAVQSLMHSLPKWFPVPAD